MKLSHRVRSAALALSVLWVAGTVAPANAAMLNPFGTQFPAAAEPDPVGGAVLASAAVPFSSPGYSGTLTSTVLNNDASNPFGPAALTFTYLLTNDASSPHPINRLTVNGFDPFLTDASYNSLSVGIAPALINRPVSDVVGFTFADVIGPGLIVPGSTSRLLVIQTNATQFQPNVASVIDGFVTMVDTYSPVPEPASMALLGLGACLALRRRTSR